jgi:tetratricopeptide (TPR) repeat protein
MMAIELVSTDKMSIYLASLLMTVAFVGMNIGLFPQVAVPQSTPEPTGTANISRAVTVEIRLQQNEHVGSGVIIDRRGDLYTIVTNKQVVCGGKRCDRLPNRERYIIRLVDGQKYLVTTASIKLFSRDLDLAIVQFRSNHYYSVAKLAAPDSFKLKDGIYTAGFPYLQPRFASFGDGYAIAVANQRLSGTSGGYTIIVSHPTLPGMNGGGIFQPNNGQLLGINGSDDGFKHNPIGRTAGIGRKIGYSRGISIDRLVKNPGAIGTNVIGERSGSDLKAALPQIPASADELLIAGFDRFIEPGSNVTTGTRAAIQTLSKAIELNPKSSHAYFVRAVAYERLREFKKSLSDYDRAIALAPRFKQAHNNRGVLKSEQFNDLVGARDDHTEAIGINPESGFEAYYNRALLNEKLDNVQGALFDYTEAINANPQDAYAYHNRAILKERKLHDRSGAIQDFRQAARIFRAQGDTRNRQLAIATLKALGSTE